ncbi:MAG: EAL domain-containing protein [Erysipelotrichaceae bacterium]|nr:EAL domain-containing protein [Erysipelotrichaceae bacterium]
MAENNGGFFASKRLILVADDEFINRELLNVILKDDYDLIFAENGEEALLKIREYKDTLSLVLLDILMPAMTGIEVLRAAKADSETSKIPIVVVTSESAAEVESLQLGAIDFIPKPYPNAEVIKARVLRTIELSEGKDIISSTERDSLTGLYNKEFFYRYAEQFDQFHKDTPMDAVVLDVNHFRMINERYGNAYGDEVLCRIGEKVREMVRDSGGIVCRKEADTFLIYCPHREDYKEIIENASVGLAGDDSANNRVRLRIGVYSDVDKTLDIERRFDHAKTAADSVKNSFAKNIGIYDNEIHEKELYAEQLIEEFPRAIKEGQFKVFYQPKFDVRPDTPILVSAEALVRWIHPELGMISPGAFIPLFEENGLIQKLDDYVWRQTAKQIREWKDNFNYGIPVSVNVSRIDMYDPNLKDTIMGIIEEAGLESSDLILEVTESAYTEDSAQIIRTVEDLRSLGFMIEMDDFGTGYSSLNMISNLPIDAIKLDMQFVRSAFKEGGNTRMVEIIIDIADFLKVPVIAEGVETENQLNALKRLGCDIVQGYFFSKPVPSKEFEPFILQRKEAEKALSDNPQDIEDRIRQAQIGAIRNEYGPIDSDQDEAEEYNRQVSSGVQLRTANIFFTIIAFVAALALLMADMSVSKGYQRMKKASDRYISAQLAASDMVTGSDYLTDRVRCFVVTGELQYLNDFFEEVEVTQRRDHAVEDLEVLLEGQYGSALTALNNALNLSNELVDTEYLAMRLMLETGDYDMSVIPAQIANIKLSDEYQGLSKEEMKEAAQNLVFDNQYMHYKDRIRENVSICTQTLITSSSQELEQASARLSLLVTIMTGVTLIFLLIVLCFVIFISLQIRRPLTKMVSLMQEHQPIEPKGVEELRFVGYTYNKVLEQNRSTQDKLSYEAAHDALTGLFNRGAYQMLIESIDTTHIALLIVDVDLFKQVNDTYGHAIGDRVLKKVAEILKTSFRSVDIICRYGGDEFVVVMTRVNSSMKQMVLNKVAQANETMMTPNDDLPPVSLSVGVAFSDRSDPRGDLFADADTALYQAKKKGGGGCMVYE